MLRRQVTHFLLSSGRDFVTPLFVCVAPEIERWLLYTTKRVCTMSLPVLNSSLVQSIRFASRQLVRELGFMHDTLAGTDFPASAVHILIEIGEHNVKTAAELSVLLNLDKSNVSRVVRTLINTDQVAETKSDTDSREKWLSLTPRGRQSLTEINGFAEEQVLRALTHAPSGSGERIREGMQIYAAALQVQRTGTPVSPSPAIQIVNGYRPGIIARAVEMHAHYYSRTVGFGRFFETWLSNALADFASRLDQPMNQIWAATLGDRIIGTLAIDGQDLGGNKAHLRTFIVDDGSRGVGIGRQLISHAIAFVDKNTFEETHLWTFKGLDAARRLYEAFGFVLVDEVLGTRWGVEVTEQLFVRKFGASAMAGSKYVLEHKQVEGRCL